MTFPNHSSCFTSLIAVAEDGQKCNNTLFDFLMDNYFETANPRIRVGNEESVIFIPAKTCHKYRDTGTELGLTLKSYVKVAKIAM